MVQIKYAIKIKNGAPVKTYLNVETNDTGYLLLLGEIFAKNTP